MQAQARICPKCKDDHSEGVTCRESELGQEVVKLRTENRRLLQNLEDIASYNPLDGEASLSVWVQFQNEARRALLVDKKGEP